jgi:hypothetical protein
VSETRRTIDERLYALLPAVHRIRDNAQGEPLRALLAILEHELLAVRDDTAQLYDDWFIETCREWVVPYIGDLLGVELMRSIEAEGFSSRAYVANTLSYRRRKGTAAVLEQLARDVTGWRARAVEYFERLCWSQHMQHVRLHAPATASLRNANRLELVDGPFGVECHTAEVRLITSGRGRFNIPNVGMHLWRLRAYPLERVDPRPVIDGTGTVGPGRFHFDPLGHRGPLFNEPRAESDVVHLAEERDVPARLRRRALFGELAALAVGEEPPVDGWFGTQPVLRVFKDGGATELRHPELKICHLDVGDNPATEWRRPSVGEVSVDPQSGRLAFDGADPVGTVLVDFAYAFSGDLGGGPYDRRATLGDRIDDLDDHHGVSRDILAVDGETVHATLGDAIAAWNFDALAAWTAGGSLNRLVTIMDSRTYTEELTLAAGRCVFVPPNSRLRLVAAQWPEEDKDPTIGSKTRTEGRLAPTGVRPHLLGSIEVIGLKDESGQLAGGALELDGLLIEGTLTVLPGELERLVLRHCTLVPGLGGLVVESTEQLGSTPVPLFSGVPLSALATNSSLEIELYRCIVDGISLTGAVGSLSLRDAIVDVGARRRLPTGQSVGLLLAQPQGSFLASLAAARLAPDAAAAFASGLMGIPAVDISWSTSAAWASVLAPEADADIDTSTILGEVVLRGLEGSESLFVGFVDVRVVQQGCLRYSFASENSRVPRRFRCQPDLALEAAQAAAAALGEAFVEADTSVVTSRVWPAFTSTTYGHPAYCQLARSIAAELYTGAEDGSEMGAFSMLKQAHREANLRAALGQYLRFGLDAGLFFAT